MAGNRADRIISWSKRLALIACLLIVPVVGQAATPGRRADLARVPAASDPVPLVDVDGDGVPVPQDCDDNQANVHPAYPQPNPTIPAADEICDGRDNDCDTLSDEGPGYTTPGTPCSAGVGTCEGFTDSVGSPAQYVCTSTTTSACNAVPLANGTACNDGDLCTGPDFCTSGVCGAGALITVSSNNMNGWAFNVDSPDGTGTFVTGPATPPLGTGSARLETGTNGDWSAQIRNVDYNGTKLADLTSLSYSTYATSWNGQQLPYLSLEVDLDNDGTLDDRLFFEPPYQTPSSGNPALPDQGAEQLATWQTWNALAGGWWSNGAAVGDSPGTGVKPLSDWVAAFPQARMRNKLDGLGAIRLLVGYASPTDVFDGNVDAFVIGVAGVVKTYNFETTDPCADPFECTTDTCVVGQGCVSTNKSSGTACGDSDNAACNAPDTCDGAGACVDRKKGLNTVCLAGTLPCDPNDVCDGTTNVCAPVYAASGTSCGSNDNSACNAPDTCDGGGSCIDRKKASGFVCLLGTLPCDPDDTCDGTTNTCAVIHATNGMACDDGDKCTGTDYCTNGVCAGPTLITVSSNNMHGWSFVDDTTDGAGTGTFVAGPGIPPLGTGSVRLALSTATDRQIIGTFAHGGTRLADITRLEYSTYRSSLDASNILAVTLQFDIDYDLTDNSPWAPAGGNPTGRRYQGRLVFEPYISNGSGTVSQNTWQTWDVDAGKWWASGGPGAAICTQGSPCTTAQVLTNWPNAGIHANIASSSCTTGCNVPGRLLLKSGGPGPAGFDANADALILEVGGASPSKTTYDFEDEDPCDDLNECTIDTCTADQCVTTDRPDASTVAPADMNGWAAISRRTAVAAFLAGPPPPPLGAGSYLMATGPGGAGPPLPGSDSAGTGGKTWLGTERFNETLLSAITAMSYSTYVQASPGGNTVTIAINMYVDLDGNGSRDTTLVFEPIYTYGNPTPGVWQTWSATGAAKWWYTTNFGALVLGGGNEYQPLSYYFGLYPNAKIVSWYSTGDPVRSDGWGMNLVAGMNGAGAPWNSFVGWVDKFTLATAGDSYTADLEPAALCNDGISCTNDQCGSGACVNPPSPVGTACGSNAVTTCDLADTCNGAGACDPRYAPVATQCRASAGICDVVDFCDGAGACSPDGKSTAECRASGGVCDVADFCDGASNDCPADQKVPAATECRAAGGVCDAAESCDGTTNSCPPDGKLTTVQSFFDVFFEAPLYSPGSIQGQNGWSGGTIPINPSVDQTVDQGGANSRTGSGAWRVSNKAYNGNFNGWPFSPGLPLTAGQPSSGADGDQFNATFYFRAASAVADGSNMEVDLGSTAGDDRNNFLAITNSADADGGLRIRIAESDATTPGFFWPTLVTTTNLSRTAWHRIDILAKFYDGTNNDKFEVYVDGVVQINTRTGGTTWGTFEGFRDGNGFAYVKSNRLFWRSGAAASAFGAFPDAGAQGFWFDDVHYAVSDQASTLCRPSAGQCDVDDYCDGATNDCPADVFASNTTTCSGTSTGGGCDTQDFCLGTANTCVDKYASAATICRADAGQCDVADFCTGVSGPCPADVHEPATTACVGLSHGDACDDDANDRCTGTNNNCNDAYQSNTTVCRADLGVCDTAELCTGTSGGCPADVVEPGTTVCRADAGQCDVAEFCTGGAGGGAAAGATIFDAIPGPPLPFNVVSFGYQANQLKELGEDITFAGTNRFVTDATVTMSTWAPHSQWPGYLNPNGWTHPITLNIYAVDLSGPNPAVAAGPPLFTSTVMVNVPWRPEGDPTCGGGPFFPWRSFNGTCFNGLAFTFTVPVNVVLPSRVIYGVAFNTNTWGYAPILAPGPYESLNLGVRDRVAFGAIPVGTDNELNGGWYNDHNAPCANLCRDFDPFWAGYTPAVRFNAIPVGSEACPGDVFEPATTPCMGGANSDLCDLDAADHCLGTANTCVDAYQSNSYECRADAGQCDVPENCTGSASACPPNGFEPSGTSCTDNNVCTSFNGSPATADQCDGSGDCDGNAVTCASDGNVCTDDVCHGPSTGCTNDPICGISGTVVYNRVVPILYRCNAGPNVNQPCTTNAFCVAPNQCVAGTDASDPSNPIGDALMTLTGDASDSTFTDDNGGNPAPPAGTYSFSNVAGMITDTPTRTATDNDVLSGLDSGDSSLISKRSVGLVGPFTPRMFKAGDVSTNNAITAFDAALVSQRALGIITSWPAPSTLGSTMWFFDPVARNLNVNFTPGPNNADFVGIMYGDVSMSWSGPENPFADPRNLPAQWLALDPNEIQRITAIPGATSTIYISQAPVARPDGSFEMVLGMTQADGVMGLDLDLHYDPSIVTIESLTPVGLSNLFAVDSNVISTGVKRLAMYSPAPMQGTGDFLIVKMRINGALGGLPFEVTGSANEGAVNLEWLSPGTGEQGPGGPGQPGQTDAPSKRGQ